MAAKTTQTLGKYRIIEEIGRGGFGAVYKAVDTELDREVALKLLAPHLLWDPTFIERFRREAKAMANLNHPNIATLYDYGEREGSYFLVMEYVSGGTVRELVERGGPLPLEQVVPILEQVAAGLDYAHGRDVIHRDVKSSNVLLTPGGTAKLTDFGLVKVVAETSTLSSLGQSAGTPEYMAPEQFEGQEVGVHTDLYSLGVVLYEMCTGALPFTGPTPLAVMRGVVDKPPPDPSEVNPSLPLALAKVLLRALAKKPQDRYSSATELAAALLEAVEGEKQRARRQQLAGLRREAEAALVAADWDRLTALCGEVESLAPGDAQAAKWLAQAQKARAEAQAAQRREVEERARQQAEEAALRREAEERARQQAEDATQRREAKARVRQRAEEAAHRPAAVAAEREQVKTPAPETGCSALFRQLGTGAGLLVVLFVCAAGMIAGGLIFGLRPAPMPQIIEVPREVVVEKKVIETVVVVKEVPVGAENASVVTTEAPVSGATSLWEKDGSVMVYVPAGEFTMGCAEEYPEHTVYLSGFSIDVTEVTNEQYERCVAAGACKKAAFADDDRFSSLDQPVVGVRWRDAQAYCEWVGKRLPTEAEWEKAARGTDGRRYPWGDTFDGNKLNFCDANCDYAWRRSDADDGCGYTAPVGSYPEGASPYGALDMAGNVWEWCQDWCDGEYYDNSPQRDPQGPDSGEYSVVRGGSWSDDERSMRTTTRHGHVPDFPVDHIGFRCAVSPP